MVQNEMVSVDEGQEFCTPVKSLKTFDHLDTAVDGDSVGGDGVGTQVGVLVPGAASSGKKRKKKAKKRKNTGNASLYETNSNGNPTPNKPIETKTPRMYQTELFETAKEQNSIAYLETGGGKTLIAVMLLRDRLETRYARIQKLMKEAEENDGCRNEESLKDNVKSTNTCDSCPFSDPYNFFAVFIAPRVSLVHQQADVLKRHIPAKISSFTGELVDHWWTDPMKGREELSEVDVAVMTPQVLVNAINHALLPGIHVIDTLILDEAHHCRKRNPYNIVMEFYRNLPKESPRPRVLGLTAAPAMASTNKGEALLKSLLELETNMDSDVVTVHDTSELQKVVPPPKVILETYSVAQMDGNLFKLSNALEQASLELDTVMVEIMSSWKQDVEAGFDKDLSPDCVAVAFSPGAPRFKINRLKDVLRSVNSILRHIGAYSCAYSFLLALKWLNLGCPNSRSMYSLSPFRQRQMNKPNTSYSCSSNAYGWTPVKITPKLQSEPLEELVENSRNINFDEFEKHEKLSLESSKLSAKVSTVIWKAIGDIVAAFFAVFERSYNLNFLNTGKDRIMEEGEIEDVDDKTKYQRKTNNVRHRCSMLSEEPLNSYNLSEFFQKAAVGGFVSGEIAIDMIQSLLEDLRPNFAALDRAASNDPRYLLHFAEPKLSLPLISDKVRSLIGILMKYRNDALSQGSGWSAIIFVEQRLVALGLSHLLSTISTLDWLRVSPFMGAGRNFGEINFNEDAQREILKKFRTNEINLLVSTSVAEEGIDVKSCSLVIRFDPAPTAQSFNQSRGRARVPGSHMVSLIEDKDENSIMNLDHHTSYTEDLRNFVSETSSAKKAKIACDLLPTWDLPDAQSVSDELENIQGDENETLISDTVDPPYIVASTGAQVSINTCLSLLASYIGSLPADEFTLHRPIYRYEMNKDNTVKALVRLPSSSAVRSAYGHPHSTRARAKASAALEMCKQLHLAGGLNDNLLPSLMQESEDDELEFDEDIDVQNMEIEEDRLKVLLIQKGLKEMKIKHGRPEKLRKTFPSLKHLTEMVNGDLENCALEDFVQGNTIKEMISGQYEKKTVGEINPTTSMIEYQNENQECYAIHCYVWVSVKNIGFLVPEMLGFDKAIKKDSIEDGLSYLNVFYIDAERLKKLLTCSAILRNFANLWCENEIEHLSGSAVLAHYALSPIDRESGDLDWKTIDRIVILDRNMKHAINCFRNIYKRPTQDNGSMDMKIKSNSLENLESPENNNFVDLNSGASHWDAILSALDILRGTARNKYPELEGLTLDGSFLLTPYNKFLYPFGGVASDIDLGCTFELDNRTRSFKEISGSESSKEKKELMTYEEYYLRRWRIKNLNKDQPLIYAKQGRTKTKQSSNRRQPPNDISLGCSTSEIGCVLVPEICCLHPLTEELQNSLVAIPGLLWNLEGTLLAKEVLRDLYEQGLPTNIQPPLNLIRRALTAVSTMDFDHYESLETLGDGFLKYAVSVDLFLSHSHWHEGQLTTKKDSLVSNRRLIGVALKLNLHQKLRLQKRISIQNKDETTLRGKKILADVVEALIGAFLFGCGESDALSLLRVLGLVSDQEWSLCIPKFIRQDLQIYLHDNLIKAVEMALGYRFQCHGLIKEALTHGSFLGQASYQRLEFLGDAILDTLLTQKILEENSHSTPSFMHDAKSCAGNFDHLALVSIRHGLHLFLMHTSSSLFRQIDNLIIKVESEKDQIRENCRKSNQRFRNKDNYYRSSQPSNERHKYSYEMTDDEVWDELLKRNPFGIKGCSAPKVLCDIIEALIGAVWIDSLGDMNKCWNAFVSLAKEVPGINGVDVARNPVCLLQEFAAQNGATLKFETIREAHEPVSINYTDKGMWGMVVMYNEDILAKVTGCPTYLAAQRSVSIHALEKLDVSNAYYLEGFRQYGKKDHAWKDCQVKFLRNLASSSMGLRHRFFFT